MGDQRALEDFRPGCYRPAEYKGPLAFQMGLKRKRGKGKSELAIHNE
jgi:hypothetical protein